MSAKTRLKGRSWAKNEITLREIATLLEPFGGTDLFTEQQMDGSIYDILVVDGDLSVPGNLVTFKEQLTGLIVLGNLKIGGRYEDCDDPNTGVFVKGNMSATSVITTGELVVLGDLDAGEALIGSYNDFGARVRGNVSAKLFVPEQHCFELRGKVSFDVVLGDADQCEWKGKGRVPWNPLPVDEYPKRVARSLLLETDPDALSEMSWDEALDHDEVMQCVRKGAPVLRR